MFNNVGEKIKAVAKAWFYIGVFLSVVCGLICLLVGLFNEESFLVLSGLSSLVIGPFSAWLSTLFLYGFGELIDTNQKLNEAVEDELVPTIKDLSIAVSKISVVSGTPTSSAPRQIPPVQDDDDEDFSGNFVVDTSVADSFEN